MLKELLGSSTLLDVPVYVMVFFMAIFAGVLLHIASRRRSAHYRAMSRLPLDLEPEGEVTR